MSTRLRLLVECVELHLLSFSFPCPFPTPPLPFHVPSSTPLLFPSSTLYLLSLLPLPL